MSESAVLEFVTELLVQLPNLVGFVVLAYVLYRQNTRLTEMLNECYRSTENRRVSGDDKGPSSGSEG